jgi:hypothetical protein
MEKFKKNEKSEKIHFTPLFTPGNYPLLPPNFTPFYTLLSISLLARRKRGRDREIFFAKF